MDEEESEPAASSKSEDYLFNYHRGKLVYGLILFEFTDAIKEGDGDRLFDIYKMALLLYKVGGHHKYAYITLLSLVKIAAILPQSSAHEMKWNRSFNKHGGKGHNIPLDLRMEQLNKQLKTLWRGLGANLTEKSAQRMASSLESLELVIGSVDNDCNFTHHVGYRAKGNPEEAVQQLVKDLMEKDVFNYKSGREGHPSFPKFPSSLMHKLNFRDFHAWVTGLLKEWESIYR